MAWEELDKSSLLMTAGVALLAGVFLRLALRRLIRSKSADRQSDVDARAALPLFDRSTRSSSIDASEVQLYEMGRELAAQLDSKVILLEEWIRLARIEAERLERAVDAARAQGVFDDAATDANEASAERAR